MESVGCIEYKKTLDSRSLGVVHQYSVAWPKLRGNRHLATLCAERASRTNPKAE